MTARTPGTAGRRRDAGRTREALLRAATDLFSERGFDRTTIRDIGERAGVDPALIARYFGSKTRLYLTALEEERGDVVRDVLDPERLLDIVDRVERRGLVPLLQVAVEPLRDEAAKDAAKAALHTRLVEPLVRRFTREGVDRPRLRAELAVVVDGEATLRQAHAIAVAAEHALLHALPRLTAALVHADPAPVPGERDPHLALAHHLTT